MLGLKRLCFPFAWIVEKNWRSFTFPERLGRLNLLGFLIHKSMAWRKSDSWLFSCGVLHCRMVFLWTHPYPYWEQHPGSFAGLNTIDSSTFTESLPSQAAHLGQQGWPHPGLRRSVRIQYQEEYSTCKAQLENAGSEAEVIRIWKPLWTLWIQWQAPDTL